MGLRCPSIRPIRLARSRSEQTESEGPVVIPFAITSNQTEEFQDLVPHDLGICGTGGLSPELSPFGCTGRDLSLDRSATGTGARRPSSS